MSEPIEVNEKQVINTKKPSDQWIQEIVRDTEHYFQGEMQHDQRASWLLATNGLVIAVVASFVITALENGYHLNAFFLVASVVFLTLSAIAAILVILPLRGMKPLWRDILGKTYRHDIKNDVNKLIRERFRHDDNWSDESLETRIKYHFRTHYMRYTKKSYIVLWASISLIAGLITGLIVILDLYM